MNRPDLLSLTEQDLVHATNVGIVKRAKRDAVATSATASMEGKTVVLRWSDGITCRFPPASSVRGECSCPAEEICRHLVRSILFLLQHKDSVEPAPKTRDAPTNDRQPTIDQLLSFPAEEFQKQIGKQKLLKARRAIKGNVDARVLDTTQHVVSFPHVGVDVRFPPGASLESAICTCNEQPPCSHILPALLILRGEGNAPSLSEGSIDDQIVRRSLRRVKDLLHELIRAGIDGLSPAWCDAVHTTALEIEKQGLVIPAELLRTLAREVEAEVTGESPFHPHTLRIALAKIWIRISLVDRTSTLPISGGDLMDRQATHYWAAGQSRLAGVGIRAWQSEKIRGITLYFFEERSGEIVSTGTGRPIDRNYSTLSLASRATIFGEATALELLGHVTECTGLRIAENGKVLLGEGATCEILRQVVSWDAIVERYGITRWATLSEMLRQEYPSLLSHRRDRLFWFKPRAWNEAVQTISHHAIEWPMIDADGRSLHLSYSYSNERSHSFHRLKHFAAHSSPVAVLGILRFQAGQPKVEPVTILYSTNHRMEAYCIDLESPVGR